MLRPAGPHGSSLSSPFFSVSSLPLSHDHSLFRSTLYPLRSFFPFLLIPFVFLCLSLFFFILCRIRISPSLLQRMFVRDRFFTSMRNAVSGVLAALCANDMPNCNHAKIQAALHLAFNVNRNLILTLCLLRSELAQLREQDPRSSNRVTWTDSRSCLPAVTR